MILLSSSATAFRNFRQVGLTQPIVAVHDAAPYEVVRAAGEAADNVVSAEFLIAQDPLPNQVEFIEAFQAEYGRLPRHFEAAGWDAVMAVAPGLAQTEPEPEVGALCAAWQTSFSGAFAAHDFSAPDMGG